ncbi:heme exporter protein CcmD [Alteromonas sediminis]|uniref:Heme exporter protein D n=1 Tax=Alteromonas sediminis TaxID=2259342 RepID=A0A3N5Y5E7_9ALTE|nr:heme exporter protein CcmD [Alteromonas sediminis]RPJ68276.1 heme exporter protein CcmD [Alteromonas sediminis]
MQFDSLSAFLEMGGYGFFVWLAFGVTLGAMILLVVQSSLDTKHLEKEIKDTHARKARMRAAAKEGL